MGEEIVVAEMGQVAIVTINRPAKRNAVSLAMWRRLAEIFGRFGRQGSARAVILTGAGGHFCAGADISEFATVRADAAMGKVYEEAADGATRALRDCPLPTIVAVSGYAMGGGCGLALACDFRVGDASTQMGIPAARLGIVPGMEQAFLVMALGIVEQPAPGLADEDTVKQAATGLARPGQQRRHHRPQRPGQVLHHH